MNVNEKILNREISHAIDVLGYSNSVSQKVIKLLNRADVDLFNRLTTELNKVTPSPEKLSRIKALLRSVNDLNATAYSKVSDQLKSDLRKFSAAEVEYQQNLIGSVQPVKVLPIAPEAAYAAAIATPFQGKFLSEFLAGMETQKANLIRDAVRIGFIESQTTGEIVNRIRGTRALNYTDGILNITRANAESVVLTAIAHTANVAQQALYDANEDIIKGYRYTATLDTRTTELCASRDGNYYPLGEPKPAIPAHFRCLPADSLILARCGISGVSKRWFDGDMIVIKTATNRELSCTPNHPILTNRGWVAAESLNFADKIICDGGSEWLAPIIDGNNNNVITSIHNVTEAFIGLSDVLTVPVPTAAPDFHGDGIDGEVAIISTYRFLRDGFDATIDKHIMQSNLVMRNLRKSKLIFNCSFRNFLKCLFSNSSNRVSIFCKGLPCLKWGYSHSCKLLLTTVSCFNVKAFKSIFYNIGRNIKSLSNSFNANPAIKHIDGGYDINVSLPSINSNNSCGFDSSIEDISRDIELADNLISGNICKVFSDSLVEFKRVSFSGHVYNLDTVEGWYSANGIVTHNCRSRYVAVIKSFKELGLDADIPASTRASMDGQVPDKTTYQEWLKKQSVARQNEVLGVTKAQLFRDGKLTLDKFVSPTGHVYTLDQLKERNAKAFDKIKN